MPPASRRTQWFGPNLNVVGAASPHGIAFVGTHVCAAIDALVSGSRMICAMSRASGANGLSGDSPALA